MRNLAVACLCFSYFATPSFSASRQAEKLSAQVASPPPLDVSPETIWRQVAADQAATVEAASHSPSVTKLFVVGWELHHGLYFLPAGLKTFHAAFPEFQNVETREEVERKVRFPGPETEGQRLFCRCTGVPLEQYGRFLIRTAVLEWRK